MKPGARGTTLLCFAVAAALFAAGSAFAAAQTIVANDDFFGSAGGSTTFTMDQGGLAPFQNQGANQHNVTATANGPDGTPLFSSPTIGTGSTVVNGTQFLTPGAYTFICTVHPQMVGTLAVSPSGTPVPRPALTLKLLSRSIEKVLKNGLLVQIDSTAKSDEINVVAKLGKMTISKALDISEAQGRTFVKLKLNKTGKSRLAERDNATITLSGTITSGSPTSTKGKLK